MYRFALGLAALVGMSVSLPAAAQPKWAVGQTHQGNIDLGGVQVPLPSGDWSVVAFQHGFTKAVNGTDAGGQIYVALGQLKDGVVRAYIALSYNERSMSNGWNVPASAQCRRDEIHFAKVIRDRQNDKSCVYVNHIVFSVASNSAQWWKDTIAYVQKARLNMPLATIQSGYVVSDRQNFISVAYYFNPEAVGFAAPTNTAWQTSDWNVLNVAKDEKKKSFVQSIIEWTERSRPMVDAGLAGSLKKGEGLDWPIAMRMPD